MPRKVRIENSIEYKRPWLLAEWNHCLNPNPSTVSAHSSEYFTWTCMFCGESWTAKACCHSKPGCKECQNAATSRRRSTPKPGRSLADLYPDLVKNEWDKDANTKSPECISAHARYLAHWICPVCDTHYTAWVYNRTSQGSGCPECKKSSISEKNRRPKPGTSLEEVNKSLADEWHPTKNGELTPSDVCANSGIPVWWLGDCEHEYEMDPSHRMQGCGCPFCSGKRVLVGFNDLETNFPEIAAEWDENDPSGYTPSTVTQFSGKELRFICEKHGPYTMKVNKRTARGEGCPRCAEERRDERVALIGQNFKKTHEQFVEEAASSAPTFVILGKYVDAKHPIKTLCTKCNTVSMKFPGNILQVGGCATCAAEQRKIDESEFKKRLAKVNPTVKLAGEYVMASEKALFECRECGYRWVTVGTSVLQGTGCSRCRNTMSASIPEKALAFYISKHFHDIVENARPDIPDLGRMEIDIWIPSIRTAIEYDGSAWHKDTERDLRKDTVLHSAGVRIIRIREPRCPTYETPAEFIFRNDEHSDASLEQAIRDTIDAIGVGGDGCDIDLGRDMFIIEQLKEMACGNPNAALLNVNQLLLFP